jgi:NADPH:quinone reductase-like Zn-dependent oxidoreductase
VRAVGINPIDGTIRQGLLEAMFPSRLPAIPGVAAPGTVDAVGEGVTRLAAPGTLKITAVTYPLAEAVAAQARWTRATPAARSSP